ncbi:hypothetical protein TcWFU_002854 [Taenia crassiceps]|uniref:FAR1 domain-containing protein n=1 Tax=Taenia crassiceps TaxID=6207 RepID=A0ABR4QPT3_9CEST
MVHNHEGYPEVDAADIMAEQCINEEDIFKDTMFDSFVELQTKMDEFQRITGSLYGKRNTKRFPAESPYATTLVYKSFAYECYHYGSHNCDASIQRVRRSAKIGCRSRIHISCYRNKLKIVRFDVKHNHDVAPEHAKAYPRNRRLTQPQLAIVESMLQANQDSHAIKEFIENTFHTPCTMSDVRNIKAKLKASAQVAAAAAVEAVEGEEEDEGEILPNLPSLHQDTSLDDMITQLTPQLEHIQDLVIASPTHEVFGSRVNCLNRLIEVWQEGKEAVVLVPQPRVPMSTERRDGESGQHTFVEGPQARSMRLQLAKSSDSHGDVRYHHTSSFWLVGGSVAHQGFCRTTQMAHEDFDKVVVSGVTLGFLSGAAFSDSFYKKGLLLGQKAKDQPGCLEIVSAFPHQLLPNTVKDYNSGSELRAVGVYKCRSCIDPKRKFSIDDYMTMSIDGIELFFLIEVHDSLSVHQKMFKVCPYTGNFDARLIRPIDFAILSIDSHINRLYEAKNMEGIESIAASVRKACDEVEKHAMDKLKQTTDALSQKMRKIYARVYPTQDSDSKCSENWNRYRPSIGDCNLRKPLSDDFFAGRRSTGQLDDASVAWSFMVEDLASPTDKKSGYVIIKASDVQNTGRPRESTRDGDDICNERWHNYQG